ncbi:hypothetical protein HPB51_023364 [Rhipicephalus microplus]|uniref:cyclin-dependent kinase n=1 Tax=Rhipicephalus microplus TaxID=6941 RepID=A0A9J6DD94_RHIMP|nr:hypothetical protein HPB51_023364 [Rhipicephalus microplus]
MKNYVILEKIGEGAYGAVYKAQCKATNEVVAIKKIRVEDGDEEIPATTIREVALLRELKHENIKYLGQIVAAILFCHKRRFLHRDLKPANVLVDENGDLKVADFGFSRAFTPPVRSLTSKVGTLWYRAPEMLLGASSYSTPVDVWSIGCIFFELLTGKTLFRGDSEIDQLFRIFCVLGTPTVQSWPEVMQLKNYKSTFPMWRENVVATLLPGIDCEAVDLLLKMLIYSPGESISAKDATAHHYLAGSRNIERAAHSNEKEGQ